MSSKNKSERVARARELKYRNRQAECCAHCGKSKPATRSTSVLREGEACWSCEECAKKHAAYCLSKRAEWRASGLCEQCGKRPPRKGVRCEECRSDNRTRAKENYHRMIALGRCVRCRRENDGPLVRCPECADKHNAESTKRFTKAS